jgi:hypothetical protein
VTREQSEKVASLLTAMLATESGTAKADLGERQPARIEWDFRTSDLRMSAWGHGGEVQTVLSTPRAVTAVESTFGDGARVRVVPHLLSDDPGEYERLDDDDREELDNWVRQHVTPAIEVNWRTSWDLFDIWFTRAHPRVRITNGCMKGAMLAAGFKPEHYDSREWHFRVAIDGRVR